MALSRRTGSRFQGSIWPGFVDAMTGLLLVLMFVLTIFMVLQAVQTQRINGQESELNSLSGEVAALAQALGIERQNAADLETQLGSLTTSLTAARDKAAEQAAMIASLSATRDAQAVQLNAAEAKITGFETQVANLLSQRDAAVARGETLEARQKELLSAQDALNLALTQARSETDAQAEAARLAAARRDALTALVDDLRAKGAVFVEELDECPDDRPVIFSAHGVPKSVPAEAANRQMLYVDATCPLVSKVHIEAERHHENGLQIVMIGHAGHPETIGTMGQLPDGEVLLVETPSDVPALDVRDPERLAFVTQTTLSIDDTADIVAALRARFPSIKGPHKEDICYATTNRQDAVKSLAPGADLVLVIGAKTSSNSVRLVEVAKRAGAARAELIASAESIDWSWLDGVSTLGLTAGASAPEDLVQGVIDACSEKFDVSVERVETARETVTFKLPRILAE